MGSINVEIPHGIGFRFRGQFHDETERNNEHHNNSNKASQNPNLVYLSSGHTELIHPTMIVVFMRRTGYLETRKSCQNNFNRDDHNRPIAGPTGPPQPYEAPLSLAHARIMRVMGSNNVTLTLPTSSNTNNC